MRFQLSLLLSALGSMTMSSAASSSSSSSSSSFQKSEAFFNAMKQSPPSSTSSHQTQLRRQKSMQKLKRSLLLHAKPKPASPSSHSNFIHINSKSNSNTNRALYYDDANAAADDEYGNYGFDISQYSLKYATCSSVATFSDDLADDEDSSTVFYTQQFVVFRLCPSDYCVNGNGESSSSSSSSSGSSSSGNNGDDNADGDGDGDDDNDNDNANGDNEANYYGDEAEEETTTVSNMDKHGCMYNYGEYMIPLQDWLDIIGEFREEEMERYCDYCKSCVGGYYGDNGNDDGNNDGNDAYYENGENRGDKYYNMGDLDDQYGYQENEADDGGNAGDDGDQAADDGNKNGGDRKRRLDGDDNADEEEEEEEKEYDCSYSDRCSGYGDVCYDEDRIDWSEFFGCRGKQIDDDTVIYVGPHCSKDKSTIVLTAFEDEYCQSYVGDKYDLATITDDMVTTGSLEEYYRSDCISCKESNLPFQAQDDEEDNDNISEICENLYDYAAKCNRHLYSANDNSYQSYQQANNEYAVCSFIASVVTGSYDEYGYIYINSKEYSNDNKYNAYAQSAIRKGVVTVGQAFGLVFFSLVMIGLGVYAAITKHRVARKLGLGAAAQEPLSGKRGLMGGKEVKRQDSGIMVCRSKSNISYKAPSSESGLV